MMSDGGKGMEFPVVREIQKLLNERNWSWRDLAKDAGLGVGTADRWKGGSIPRRDHLAAVAKALARNTTEETTILFTLIDAVGATYDTNYSAVRYSAAELSRQSPELRRIIQRLDRLSPRALWALNEMLSVLEQDNG